jgi:hypothetical protein
MVSSQGRLETLRDTWPIKSFTNRTGSATCTPLTRCNMAWLTAITFPARLKIGAPLLPLAEAAS